MSGFPTSAHTYLHDTVMIEEMVFFFLSPLPHSRGIRTASDAQNAARAWSRPLRPRRTERSTAKVLLSSPFQSRALLWPAQRCFSKVPLHTPTRVHHDTMVHGNMRAGVSASALLGCVKTPGVIDSPPKTGSTCLLQPHLQQTCLIRCWKGHFYVSLRREL